MKKCFVIVFFVPVCCFSQSNRWESIGNFSHNPRTFFEDTTNDVLFIAGDFLFFNSDTMRGIGIWNGTTMSSLGCGFDWDCASQNTFGGFGPVEQVVEFHDTIFSGGWFHLADGKQVNGITFWDGTSFQAFGTGLKQTNDSWGVCWGMSIINNELYVGGGFDSIGGIAANSLGKFDGQSWSSVHDLPRFKSDAINFINAIAEYNDELYVGGNFYDSLFGNVNDLVKWNGIQWEGISGFEEPSGIVDIVVYKDELYVSGDFNFNGDGVQNGYDIVRFDGTHWHDVGGGVSGGQIDKMVTDGKYLYVGGGFTSAGGIPCSNLARWDGNQWCSFNSEFDNKVSAIGFYRDTMYVGGGFWSIDDDTSLAKVVRYIGIDSLFPCSPPVGISETASSVAEFTIFPNPAFDEFMISTFEDGLLTITNEIGQVLQSFTIQERQLKIPSAKFPSGTYFLTFQTSKNIQTKKLLIQH